MKSRLAFVDHSFHKKTRSGDFLRILFSEQFEVVDFWDDSWEGGQEVTAAEINAGQFSHVFFFQSFMANAELRQLQSIIVWAPMYDSLRDKTNGYWLELSTIPMKILCFSSTLAKQLEPYGFDIFLTQFWFDPTLLPQVTDYSSLRLFFWQRTDMTFHDVKALLGHLALERCIVKLNPDPRYQATRPTAADIERYHITLVEGFLDKAKYLEYLQACNIFLAPRAYEGIGMSFLEAMAMGLVIVGMNHATMNEYIQDGSNGRLFSENFSAVTIPDLPALGATTRQSAKIGFARWQQDAKKMLAFMAAPLRPARSLNWRIKFHVKYDMACHLLRKKFQSQD